MNFRHIMGTLFVLLLIILTTYLYIMPKVSDGFIDVGRCGVGLQSCPDGLRCMNGYCKSDIPKYLPALSDLPVRPPRYPYSN